MIVTKDWTTRRPGDWVLAPDGSWWRVVGRDPLGVVTLDNDAGRHTTIHRPSGPVQSWDPDATRIEEFRAALGARIIHDTH